MRKTVKNLPALQETWVLSLGWEDPLEKGMAIHSSILAWRIPWTEEPGRLSKNSTFFLAFKKKFFFNFLKLEYSSNYTLWSIAN